MIILSLNFADQKTAHDTQRKLRKLSISHLMFVLFIVWGGKRRTDQKRMARSTCNQ